MMARLPTVIVTPHAQERWRQRAERRPYKSKAIGALLAQLLFSRMGPGQPVVGEWVYLDCGGDVRAVLELTAAGWVCKTVLGPEEKYEWGAG
jgi:hypothetical protein